MEKLLHDEIGLRERKNLVKARSFRELLEATLRKYHNRVITAAQVIEEMIRIRRSLDQDARRAADLGLGEDELAFYDAVAAVVGQVGEVPVLRDLVHEVVLAIKRNLKVDWTAPHREDVRSAIRAAVKRTLRKHDVRAEEMNAIVERVMEQAEALYAEWPAAA